MKHFIPFSVAMVTPFTESGEFDEAAIPDLVKYYIEQMKVPGLLVCGSTGEQHCLNISERKQLYKIVGENAPNGFPLYAGVAAFKTNDAVELAHAVVKAKFSGIMLGLPPYRLPSQDEIEIYVKAVAEVAEELPIFLYNNPKRNGVQVEPTTFIRLAKDVKNIYGLKETKNDENVKYVKESLGDDAEQYSFFSGNDATFVDAFINHGYTGLTSVAGNVYPKEMEKIVSHLQAGQFEKAGKVIKKLLPSIELLNEAGTLQSIKYILRKRGAKAGHCPPPLQEPAERFKAALDCLIKP